MRHFWQKYRGWLTLGAIALTLLLVIPGDNGLLSYTQSRNRIQQLQSRIDSLDRAIDQVHQTNLLLEQEDPLAIERIARRHDMRYPGETVYRVDEAKE